TKRDLLSVGRSSGLSVSARPRKWSASTSPTARSNRHTSTVSWGGIEAIPIGSALDRAGPEPGPESVDVEVEPGLGPCGGIGPQGLGQHVGRGPLRRTQDQQRQQEALQVAHDLLRFLVDGDLEPPDDVYRHRWNYSGGGG